MRWCTPFAFLLLASCTHHTASLPPAGQLVVHVDTDAPLPAPAGASLGPDDPPPLFDRLRLEVFRPGDAAPCVDCTHEFEVDRELVAAGRASVGITPPVGATGYRVRARLFRGDFVEHGDPRSDATLETVASLPAIAAEGVTDVTITLHTGDVARPIGSVTAPVPATLGPPQRSLVGTWPGAQRRRCAGDAKDGEVCVPGGAYWMGNPRLRLVLAPDVPVLRLVTISPFFLDANEVSVRQIRQAHIATAFDPMRYTANDGYPGPQVHCSYRDAASDSDDLAVNCISWELASAYCHAHGGDLPTEAQFQYVAGGLAGHVYVWGDDEPSCDDAVFARADILAPEVRCPGQWIEPPASGKRDRLSLPGGVIYDLAGNVSEHVRDIFQFQFDPCWGIGVFHDPTCSAPSASAPAGRHVVMGGNFVQSSAGLAAAARGTDYVFAVAQQNGPAGGTLAPVVAATGFRCARPDE
jgi:formylglycine-generating enzyme required for sulfatase activity